MNLPRLVRVVLLAGAFALSAAAVPRADDVVADPPWGWHVSTPAEAIVGMFVVPVAAVMLTVLLELLPVLPPDGPVRTDESYDWRVTALVALLLLVHVWALLPVFGVHVR